MSIRISFYIGKVSASISLFLVALCLSNVSVAIETSAVSKIPQPKEIVEHAPSALEGNEFSEYGTDKIYQVIYGKMSQTDFDILRKAFQLTISDNILLIHCFKTTV